MTNTIPLALLIEPEQLVPLLHHHNLLIIDVSRIDSYLKHHIPSAVHIPPSSLQQAQPPAMGKLPSVEQLTQLFSKIGLTPDKHVIVYDDEGGGWAGRLIWTLDVIGHHHYSYLNGGIHSWINEGHPTDSEIVTATPSNLQIDINAEPIATVEQILSTLGDNDTAIWDARSSQEYNGSKVVSKRGGHIPGAVNIDWLELINTEDNMRLVNLEQLQMRLNQQGLTRDKCIITHCQTHHRSGLTYLAMKILGYPSIKGYDGSWSEWGNRDDTPIDNQH